ncbi:hypothetical protein TrST_g6460 [Triparma strigata]|uniref:Transmembrane protein n=1 Tax=Triparma strigata TaxID=1606541 RepID=A0A9W6ZJ85_9STRA|nr:hypothetical protein TrST_g6460 [Triparma strigata]
MSYLASKFVDVFLEQMHGMSAGFNLAHLPREHCLHWWSGLSGVLFVLPAFSDNRMTKLGKFFWFLQAALSILADYVFIGRAHPIHGIDRYSATINCFRVLSVGYNASLYRHVYLAIVPLGIHLLARIAKQETAWHLWIFLHGWWHVTAPILIYWMYNDEQILFESKEKLKAAFQTISKSKEKKKVSRSSSRGRSKTPTKSKSKSKSATVKRSTPKNSERGRSATPSARRSTRKRTGPDRGFFLSE